MSGTFIYKDGEFVPGSSPKRVPVEYSNWYAGNVDPDDLRRHKEFLDRIHFKGPVWEGKKVPVDVFKQEVPNLLIHNEPGEISPHKLKQKEPVFETVRR